MLDEMSIDLVIMELLKYDSSSLDNLQKMVKVHHDLKVIIHSAHPIFKQDFRTWAADRFLIKSFDISELKRQSMIWHH